MKKKPTSYIIWGMATLPIILSVAFWLFLVATRQPYNHSVSVEVYEPMKFQNVDKAVLYLGDSSYDLNVWSYDSCSVEGSFHTDTLVIISNDKSITFYNYND